MEGSQCLEQLSAPLLPTPVSRDTFWWGIQPALARLPDGGVGGSPSVKVSLLEILSPSSTILY